MARNLYLASLEPAGGKSVVTLGLLELLSRRIDRLGYFRPVIPSGPQRDFRIELATERYQLGLDYDDCYAYTADEVAELHATGRTDELFTGILDSYKALERRCDFILCDGTDYTGMSAALEFEFNVHVANHLAAPVVALVNGRGKDGGAVIDAVRLARESLVAEGCTLAVTVVNRIAPEDLTDVAKTLDALPDHEPIYCLPEVPLLSAPTVGEVVESLGGRHVRGETGDLTREVTDTKVAAMTLPNVLDYISDGTLLITPGDRADVIVGSIAARCASTYPEVAGLLLSGGLTPDPRIIRLLDGLHDATTPVFLVDTDTYTTAQAVHQVRPVIRPTNERKIATALGLFEEHVDLEELEARIAVTRSQRVTPLMFEYELIERARADRRHIVLPEGTDDRILRAAGLLQRRGVCDLTLLGDEAAVSARATALSVDVADIPVVDPATSPLRERFIARYLELRAHKGVKERFAEEAMHDVGYFGTMMVHEGLCDGMVSGAAHTTGHTIRPAFEFIRTKPGISIVSSVFFMCLPDRVVVYGDCAVNPNPDAEQLADIALSSAETAAQFGIEPVVAMLSYSTGESGKGEEVEKVREATRLARERRPDLKIDGPIQYDAAVDASVAEAKMPGSEVAGHATVFIFPDLNTGNNTYKAVQRTAGAVAIGPVLQGLNKPVNDLSRGCLVTDIVNTVAITAIQAQEA